MPKMSNKFRQDRIFFQNTFYTYASMLYLILLPNRLYTRGWTGGAGVRGWRVRNRGWRVRNRGWRGREAGVEGGEAGIEGAGSLERLGREIDFFFIENSKKMAVLCL